MRKLCLLFYFLPGLSIYAADPTCTGLCLKQVACTDGGTTSISGTVYAPNGVDPLPNVLVFIPNAAVGAMPQGVSCTLPGTPPSGSPLVGTTTAANGTFKLVDVPVDTNIPLVIQAGSWRRQLTVATTSACADTTFSARFPRNKTEGDIPHVAVATGRADSVECVLRKIGIEESEFTNPLSTGRIHLYAGAASSGAVIDANTPSENILMQNLSTLKQYDAVMLPCQGTPTGQTTPASLSNLLQFANVGGRVYASHLSYTWFYQNAGFASVANWVEGSNPLPDGSATVDTSFTGGKTLSDWLQVVGASTAPGQVGLGTVKRNVSGVNPPNQIWLTLNNAAAGNPVMQFTFNAPVGSANQCGRVLFNDYHVEHPASSPTGKAFPTECNTGPMTSQEKLLEYSLFDLTNSGSALTMTPDAVDFGSQATGFISSSKVFTWTNNSIFNASVRSATVTGDFVVQSNTCQNVMPGAFCQIEVAFQPKGTGPASGVLRVVSNASTLTANLTGTGTPALIISTAALGFPNTDVGDSVALTYTLRNGAPGPVALAALAIMGDYAQTNDCGASLPVGASCTVRVTFTPQMTGSRPGSLTLASSPSVALVGTGVDFTIAMTPASGILIAGKDLTTPATLLPISGFSAGVTITCTTNAPGSTCIPSQASAVPSTTAGTNISIATISKYTVVGYTGFGRGIFAVLAAGSALLLWRRRGMVWHVGLGIMLLGAGCGLMTGCSGKLPDQNTTYTPAGRYTYTVTATDGFLRRSATFTLNVTAN
jgi:hypothetical protein